MDMWGRSGEDCLGKRLDGALDWRVLSSAVEEKERFLHMFVRYLAEGPLQKASSSHFLTPEQTAVRICENLCKICPSMCSSFRRLSMPSLTILRFEEFSGA